MPYCIECGGLLEYDRELKSYYCKSCGATFSLQELLILRDKKKLINDKNKNEKKKKMEYLEWWLSEKEKKSK
jgi:DNA-directed RNA polymerase subunit M/transcription elongation factor TFIIS